MSLFFEDVLTLLRDGGVHHVIVGGTAVILHGVPRIDVLIDSPVEYAELSRRAERVEAGGLVIHVAAIDDLIRMKLAAGREQDLDDVDALRRVLEVRHGQ